MCSGGFKIIRIHLLYILSRLVILIPSSHSDHLVFHFMRVVFVQQLLKNDDTHMCLLFLHFCILVNYYVSSFFCISCVQLLYMLMAYYYTDNDDIQLLISYCISSSHMCQITKLVFFYHY